MPISRDFFPLRSWGQYLTPDCLLFSLNTSRPLTSRSYIWSLLSWSPGQSVNKHLRGNSGGLSQALGGTSRQTTDHKRWTPKQEI